MIRFLRLLLLLFILSGSLSVTSAQDKRDYYFNTISALFDEIAGSYDDNIRKNLSDSLVLVVDRYLNDDLPFYHKLDGVKYLGQIFAPDSLVKIVSWNIAFMDGTNRYTTFIVRRLDNEKSVWMVDSELGISMLQTDTEIGYRDWYGSLYYDIRSFTNGDIKHYLLLGLDMNGLFTNGKVIEILRFNEENEPLFGAPLINIKNGIQHRMIFKYSANVSMMLRYDADVERVVFDHLSPPSPGFEGEYQYYGPDFSYDALEFRDGFWWLREDIDLRNKEF